MRGTNEAFTDYEKYLKRYAIHFHRLIVVNITNEFCRFDWLNQVRDRVEPLTRPSTHMKQKKFTDAVNGKSGLTYWDALESEVNMSHNLTRNPVQN